MAEAARERSPLATQQVLVQADTYLGYVSGEGGGGGGSYEAPIEADLLRFTV